jgi:hypothetical protein
MDRTLQHYGTLYEPHTARIGAVAFILSANINRQPKS